VDNFKSNGGKKGYVLRADKRWSKTVLPVMKILEELRAHHIISYMDAIYIPKIISSNHKASPADVKGQKKHNDSIKGLYNDFLYHDLDEGENKYANHPYLKDHYKANSCVLTAIIETYYSEFRKTKSNGQRRFKANLTYEYLCDLFCLDCTHDNIGCSLKEATPFFEKFRIGLKVFDIYNNVIQEHVPSSRQPFIKPAVLYLVTYNEHVFTLNDNLKTLQQKVDMIGASPIDVNKISQNYRIQDQTDDCPEYHVCESWKEIKELIERTEGTDDDKEIHLQIQYYGVLNQLVYEIVFLERYTPKVNTDGQMVTCILLNMKQNKRKFKI